MRLVVFLLLSVLAATATATATANSICFGTTSNGRLEAGCKLPASGENFSPYSRALRIMGRTYVHCDVQQVILDSYRSLHESLPDHVFVYGETGKHSGGPFPPHKTHQNGLSVDFMVPVQDDKGHSVKLPTHILNKYGYNVDFTLDGDYKDIKVDFEAIAAHLAAVKFASESVGIKIWRVLFDPQMQPALRKTATWPEIASLKFSTRRSWVRHDDHYHVDFETPCKSL